ncbi:MAG TPA: hypothetical protein VMF06_07790, partial [Candidatus Limnocylindria bacterium]|nr:hypothetical protein [Candidatus Limnocylindria bacterium]
MACKDWGHSATPPQDNDAERDMTTSYTLSDIQELTPARSGKDTPSHDGFHEGHGSRVLAGAMAILSQGEDLLGCLNEDTYTRRIPVVFNASIGGHYRHCLDHFTSFLRGVDVGFI